MPERVGSASAGALSICEYGLTHFILFLFFAIIIQYCHSQEAKWFTALVWFRGTEDVQTEMDIIKSEADADASAGSVSLTDLFANPMLRSPLIISCVIMLAQQFSGINAVGKNWSRYFLLSEKLGESWDAA